MKNSSSSYPHPPLFNSSSCGFWVCSSSGTWTCTCTCVFVDLFIYILYSIWHWVGGWVGAGMGSRGNCQEDGKKKKKKMPSFSKAASTRSWGTSTNSGQSLSTGASGSAGSPSIRSELATATPAATESAFVRLNQQLDDALGDDDDTAG